MDTVKVLQLGNRDFSTIMHVSACAKWCYEPDFSELPKKDFDVLILDREIAKEEFDYLMRFSKAYCVFLTENAVPRKGSVTGQLFKRKMGKKISFEELRNLLENDLPDYFPGSYGEKYAPQFLSVAQGFKGSVSWRGYENVDLTGDYGDELAQIVFWRNNIPIHENQAIEFWLEYAKEDTVAISLEISLLYFTYNTKPDSQKVWSFSEDDLKDIVYVENHLDKRGFLFVSLKAKGHGRLTITGLHDRYSRRGKGAFLPGGKRAVTAEREEIFYYFDPGNLKPPLNVYFSGYKTKEGFEGYYMMRNLGHPFLLIAECRLEGGAFYLGSKAFENTIERIIRKYMEALSFKHSQVILSGLSMGTFGALYYGCRIRPNTILLGKPLINMGIVAENERLKCPEGSHSWLDVLRKACGSLKPEAARRLDDRFWERFDRTDWSKTRFAAAYMIEDDLDGNAYENLKDHLSAGNTWIYGKGLHGRHNDDTYGIVSWFQNQYREIIRKDFDEKETGRGG